MRILLLLILTGCASTTPELVVMREHWEEGKEVYRETDDGTQYYVACIDTLKYIGSTKGAMIGPVDVCEEPK